MSFAYPAALALLAAPVLLIAWVWRRESGRIVLPLDHAGHSRGRGGAGHRRVGAGPDPGRGHRALGRTAEVEGPANKACAYEYRILCRRLEQHDVAAGRRDSL